MGHVLFVLSNTFAVTVAVTASDILMGNREVWRRNLAAIAGFPVVVLAVLLPLGSLGHLSALSATLLVGGLAGIAIAIRAWLGVNHAAVPTQRACHDETFANGSLVDALAAAFFAGLASLWIFLLVFSQTTFSIDDLSYHAPAVAQWVIDQRLSLAPLNYHAYYPFNAEILTLWFVLPFHADGWASLSGLYWGILMTGAGMCVLAARGYPRAVCLLTGSVLLVSPVILKVARTFSAVDLAGAALLIAALALSIPSEGDQARHASLVDGAYAGLLSGFAVGCKISFLVVLPLLFVWQFFRCRRQQSRGTPVLAALIFVFAAAATGTYWYARNWMLTDNPLFPAAVGPFDGPFGSVEQNRTTLIHWIVASGTSRTFWRSLLEKHMDWPFGVFLVSALGYGRAISTLKSRDGTMKRTHTAGNVLMLATGFVLLASYPFMPFTGTFNEPDGQFTVTVRYLLAPFAIGIIMFGGNIPVASAWRTVWLCMAILGIAVSTQLSEQAVFVVIIAAAGSLWLHASVKGGRVTVLSASAVRSLGIAIVPAALILGSVWTPYRQRLTDLGIYRRGGRIGPALQALERLPRGTRVAWFWPASWQYYALYGRELQFVPAALNDDGTPYQPLHEVLRRHGVEWWASSQVLGAFVPDRDFSNVVSELAAARVSYVLISKWGGDKWPREQEAVAKSGGAVPVFDDGYSTIWKIVRTVEDTAH